MILQCREPMRVAARAWRVQARVPAWVVRYVAEVQARAGRLAVAVAQVPQLRGELRRLRADLGAAQRGYQAAVDRERKVSATLDAAVARADEAEDLARRAVELRVALEQLLCRPQIRHEHVEPLLRHLGGD